MFNFPGNKLVCDQHQQTQLVTSAPDKAGCPGWAEATDDSLASAGSISQMNVLIRSQTEGWVKPINQLPDPVPYQTIFIFGENKQTITSLYESGEEMEEKLFGQMCH